MTLEEQLFQAVTAGAGVHAAIGTRFYPDRLPDQCPMPAAAYFVVSDIPESTLNGVLSKTMKGARVQVDVYAKTRGEASRIGDVLAEVIDGFKGPTPELVGWLLNSRTYYDDVSQCFRTSMDFGVQR